MLIDRTVLVNPCHAVPEGFRNAIELVSIPVEEGFSVCLEAETARAFLALQDFLGKTGLPVLPLSGYRSSARQQEIWDRSVHDHGLEHTVRYLAKPGFSEHETGLALDVVLYDRHGNGIENDEAPEYEIMFPHLHEFGFILRYPRGQESVTGYSYEPWHIRYVGIQAAKVIHENHWTLEEFKKMENRP